MSRVAGARNAPYTSTVQGAFDEAKAEFESLREEICDWRDNMEGNGMENVPKFEEVSEAAELLESGVDALDSVFLSDLGSVVEDLSVTTTQDTRRKASSRAHRAGNAIALLYAVKDELETFAGLDVTFESEAKEKAEELAEAVQAAADEIGIAIDEFENVTYPGMFGR